MKSGHLGLAAACFIACLVLPTHTARADGYAEHVVIILDGSGSMNDPMKGNIIKMDAAKRALKQVLQQIDPSTQVGMLVFSDQSSHGSWAYPLGDLELNSLNEAIDEVRPGGGTPLGAFIKRGADALIETRREQFGYGTYRLLIVTDGEATDMDDMVRYAREVPLRGITMDVIGVKMDQAPALSKLAHSYREADDPESLARAIEEVFAEVGSTQSADTQASDFDLLEALPFEVAEAMLTGLANDSGEAIGTVAAAPVRQNGPAPQRTGAIPPPPGQSGGGSSPFGGMGVAAICYSGNHRGALRQIKETPPAPVIGSDTHETAEKGQGMHRGGPGMARHNRNRRKCIQVCDPALFRRGTGNQHGLR